MGVQWLKFLGFSSILVGIILICVIFGGYSSLHRSEGRIESSKELLLETCQKRLGLIPKLLAILQEDEYRETIGKLNKTEEIAKTVLDRLVLLKSPLSESITLELETTQNALTKELANVFLKREQSAIKYNKEEFNVIKKEFFASQNKLSIAKSRYNTEVKYFETRTKIFPGFIIAKLFGFNELKYYELSDDSFLEAESSFGGQT